MKTTDLAAVALSTLLWYTVTKKSLILAIKYNFNFLHFRAVKTILWRLCVYNPSVKNAAVSINADRLLISSVLQADGTDYFIPSLHTERNSTNTVIYNTVIFASRQFVEVDGVLGMQVIALPRNHLHLYLFKGLYHTVIFQSIYIYIYTHIHFSLLYEKWNKEQHFLIQWEYLPSFLLWLKPSPELPKVL